MAAASSFPQATTVLVTLKAGLNLITFNNPANYAPDLDRIVISGDGKGPPASFTTYEAEGAQLIGSANAGGCSYCSGGAYVGNFGGGTQNAVTFNNITAPQAGTYQLEIDYTEDGPRSFYVYVNGGTPIELDVNGSSWDSPQFLLLPVQLNAGANSIVFTNPNPSGYAPGLDSITVGPIVKNANLNAAITHKSGPSDLRLWQLSLSNTGSGAATQTTLDSFTIASNDSSSGCKAATIVPMPSAWERFQQMVPGTSPFRLSSPLHATRRTALVFMRSSPQIRAQTWAHSSAPLKASRNDRKRESGIALRLSPIPCNAYCRASINAAAWKSPRRSTSMPCCIQ